MKNPKGWRVGDTNLTKSILLVMQRKILSDALIAQTSNDTRFELTAEGNYATAALTAEACSPEVAMVEIPESGPWKPAEKCLAICDAIRKRFPSCERGVHG